MIDLAWIRDLQHLKRMPRAGWLRVGVPAPESVAAHSFATALLAWRIAREEPGLDAARVALLALVHDVHEARIGDIASPGKRFYPEGAIDAAEAAAEAEQWSDDAEARALLDELRAGETAEARLVRAADHLEFLLQAADYRASGFPRTEAMLARGRKGPAFAHPATRPLAERLLAEIESA